MSVTPETPAEPPVAFVAPPPGTRLSELLARYDELKDRRDALEAELKDLTESIKVEAAQTNPGATRLELSSPGLQTPLRMSYVETWRFDSTRFKKDDPHTYVRYAKKSSTWKLERARQR
ncbi:hypothetical protein ORV05_04720 [Amycolatopsis cynarae]|uniref:Uncharacterized protein n=1 Tax=Amycolatopsis cynarae TaxID=2995223 RepID=A0ABY7B586_9PSEU|nr:hypothetical protein [Amycolatopsis sp. HUAS 11-8]WAL67094.1 hypothetical protein ORV05_04720 [Amycolatopsis sp. HUAS 11-8]